MIGSSIEQMLTTGYDNDYLIDAQNVAHVMVDNTALHAAMVLVSVGYNSIPVLDKENHFLGTISLANIMKALFDVEPEVDLKYLSELHVGDIMNRDVKALKSPIEMEDMLHELVDHNYVAVINQDNEFIGILTRKEMLKAINYVAHELEHEYEVTPRKE